MRSYGFLRLPTAEGTASRNGTPGDPDGRPTPPSERSAHSKRGKGGNLALVALRCQSPEVRGTEATSVTASLTKAGTNKKAPWMLATGEDFRVRGIEGGKSRPRVFYGWWIVAACLIVLTLVVGIGLFRVGVFLPSLEREFGASPALVSLGATVFFLVLGFAGPYVRRRGDLLDTRLVMVVGSALFGLGLTRLALSQQLWKTYFAYAVIPLGIGGTALIPLSALISNWFRARRGLGMAVAMCGISFGGVVMTPLATQLIVLYGWRRTALALAVLMRPVGVPLWGWSSGIAPKTLDSCLGSSVDKRSLTSIRDKQRESNKQVTLSMATWPTTNGHLADIQFPRKCHSHSDSYRGGHLFLASLKERGRDG